MPLDGTITAVVTPMVGRGEVDESAFRAFLRWQADQGVDGVVVGGTTGESPTLMDHELQRLFETAVDELPSKVKVVAAVGRNHLPGTVSLCEAAVDLGIESVLLVDPYYSGPSSMEIRREHIEPVAAGFPSVGLVPYVVPGRTGTRLEPVDVARLVDDRRNLSAVKDATGDDAYARELRRRCPGLSILSGDDGRTLAMVRDPDIRATGVISVTSNLAPDAVARMVRAARDGDRTTADREAARLRPLFDSVSILAHEQTPSGESVAVRSRNPVPIKTALALLGVPVGRCRPPLGQMGPVGFRAFVDTLTRIRRVDPGLFQPLTDAFGDAIDRRLSDAAIQRELSYANW